MVVLHHPHLQHPLHLHPHLQVLQVLDVDHLNGKEMDIAMMKTTMMVAIMMVEIVVVMMCSQITVMIVTALIPMKDHQMKMIFVHLKIHAEQIKEIVILMKNAKKISYVEQIIVQIH